MQADVYDVDARTRTAPDALGVLSHYKGVIWYTGDDIVTRKAGWAGGNADRLALDEMLEMRAYMDEGGRVAYTGKTAGMQFTAAAVGVQYYDPKNEGMCHPNNRDPHGIRGAACSCAAPRRAATRSTTCCSTGSAAWSRSPATARTAPRRTRSTASGTRSAGWRSGRWARSGRPRSRRARRRS